MVEVQGSAGEGLDAEGEVDIGGDHDAFLDHHLHAADGFLGGLEDELDRAGELRCELVQHFGDAEQGGDVADGGLRIVWQGGGDTRLRQTGWRVMARR